MENTMETAISCKGVGFRVRGLSRVFDMSPPIIENSQWTSTWKIKWKPGFVELPNGGSGRGNL